MALFRCDVRESLESDRKSNDTQIECKSSSGRLSKELAEEEPSLRRSFGIFAGSEMEIIPFFR